jgi:hypothetical protein
MVTMEEYAPFYSDTNIQKALGSFQQSLEPSYQRSLAQIATAMGGQGIGTPQSNKMQLANQGYMSTLAQYLSGLQGAGMQAAQSNYATQQQHGKQTQANLPFNIAQYTGQLPGSTATYNPNTGYSWAGGQTSGITPYQQEAINAANTQKEMQSLQSIINAFGGVGGLLNVLGGINAGVTTGNWAFNGVNNLLNQ